jgi:AcrR family transcriptional regulator
MSPRQKLLNKCLRYFLNHGVADLSLRPLAREAGTSARMLIHYFDSKERLIAAVMAEVRDKFQSILHTVAARPKPTAPDLMLRFWRAITTRKNLPYLRLLLEVQVLAIQNPRRYQGYLAVTSASWLSAIERTFPSKKDRVPLATLCTAVIDGLILELLSTNDPRRTLNALHLFVRNFPSIAGRTHSPLR